MRTFGRAGRTRLVLLAMGLVLLAPSGVLAADGEIGDMGDTDSVTDVFVSGGRPAVNIDYLRDCAAGGITDCWIEVRFVSKCPEIWCGWSYQPFRRIPSTGYARGDCLGAGNEENQWFVEYRTAYVASGTKTVRWKAELELILAISGGFVNRWLVEAMYNVTAGAGFSGGTTVETVTAISDYGPIVQVASSGGRQLWTC